VSFKPATLTDDGIDSILSEIIVHLESQFPSVNFEEDSDYEAFRDKVFALLEPYSNGYRNYN
jgi:hypothetical protein